MQCPNCSSIEIEFIENAGQAVCVQCGTVLEENTIVSTVEFQESGDRSHVIGQFVSATSSKAYGSGSRGNSRYGFSRESREATLANARRNISQVASSLRLPSYFIDRAQRLYSLALQRNFVYGRRQMHIVATVLYTICRQEKSPHLLIDFSDVLQVNVYTLGKSFLQLTKLLNLNLMVVDPSLYIHRFATRLELGEKVNAVTTTALRIVSRMKKDWINTGRRPDGVCAAAMLLACRSYEIMKDLKDLAKIFRVSVVTIKKRLLEFRNTPAAQLTLLQFHQHDFQTELDPPIFMKQQHVSAAQKGMRLTFDLNEVDPTNQLSQSQHHPIDPTSQFTTQETFTADTQSQSQSFETMDIQPGTPTQSLIDFDITFNQKGQLVQRVQLDGVDVLVPLPSETVISMESIKSTQTYSEITGKRRASTQRKLDKFQRKRVLYGTMYAEMTEVIDASVDNESIRETNEEDRGEDNDNEDEEEEDREEKENRGGESQSQQVSQSTTIASTTQGIFPQLIAEESTQQQQQQHHQTSKSSSTSQMMEGSVNGSVTGKSRQLVDALYLEAQEVERQADQMLDNWGSYPETTSYSSFPSSQIGSTHGAYVILRGDGKDETKSNEHLIEENDHLDSNIDALFLTQEEQQKKTAIWEKMHRQFLDERLRKRQAKERGEGGGGGSGGMKTTTPTPPAGSNLNKLKAKKDLNIAVDPSKLTSSTSWDLLNSTSHSTSTSSTMPPPTKVMSGSGITSSSSTTTTTTGSTMSTSTGSKKIRIGASFAEQQPSSASSASGSSSTSSTTGSQQNKSTNGLIGSLVENILEEEKSKQQNKDKDGMKDKEKKEDEEENEEDEDEEGEDALVYDDYGGGMDDYDDDGDDEYY